MSKKRYFAAHYRVFDEVEDLEYNDGYICINEDSSIIGIFTFDTAQINFDHGTMIFSLRIDDIDKDDEPIDFICNGCEYLKPMTRYFLECDEVFIYLTIGSEITNPTPQIKELFANFI